MGDAGSLVETGVNQLRIGQPTDELSGGEAIKENLIGARAGGELTVGCERHGVDRIQRVGQRLPLDRPDNSE